MRIVAALVIVLILAACEPTTPPEHDPLPTLLALPSETVTPVPTTPDPLIATNATLMAHLVETQTAQAATVVALSSASPVPQPTGVPSATATLTPSVTLTPAQSATLTFTPSITVTPSLTITETPTRTPTLVPSPTENLERGLIQLAILALSSTPPPAGLAPYASPTGFVSGSPITTLCLPPTGGFAAVYAADAPLAAQIGCPLGTAQAYPAAVQTFERGTMVYLGTSPASIYVLYSNGAYARYSDTWVDGIDPVSGGETPPSGLIEPIRGFGKVWRTESAVRNGLGWATQPESGTTGTVHLFQSGQMIALPPLGQVAVLTSINTYRLIAGSP